MNRIEEIKVETDMFCDQNYFDAPEVYYNLMWEDKFAELIVRECVGIVDGYYFKPTEVADLIRNHFGVTE